MTLKILLAGNHLPVWGVAAWAQALQAMGTVVYRYDWRREYSVWPLEYIEDQFLLGPGIWRINRRLLQIADRIHPDVILIYAGQPITPQTVRTLASCYTVAGYHNDDPFGPLRTRRYFRFYLRSLPFYTCHHVFRAVNIDEYLRAGCHHVRLLRIFYVPWIHCAVHVTQEDQRRLGADVVFVGNAQPGSRIDYIISLVKAGVNIRIYGYPQHWHRSLPRWVLHRLPPIVQATGVEYVKAIRCAKICLAFFSNLNRDQYSTRSFEIPACGGFMLAERTPVMELLFEEGREAEYFSSKEELIDKIHRYLQSDRERLRIATAGRERCLRDGHDVVSRMRQWLSDLREWGLICGG